MTLLRRRPRMVYRVYAEDEFLDGAGHEFFDVAEEALPSVDDRSEIGQPYEGESGGAPVDVAGPAEPFRPAAADVGERRLRRLAGAAMLVGAVGAVGGVVVANGLRPARGAADPRTGGGSPPATRSYAASRLTAATRSPSPAHRRAVTRALSAWAARPAVVAHTSHGGWLRGGHEGGAWRSHAKGTPREAGVERGGAPAIVARSTASAPTGLPWPGHGEFGFER